MRDKKLRNTIITVFTILWIAVFHYESVRGYFLNPFIQKNFPGSSFEFPKVKFLFPPAGWIMFFQVDARTGAIEFTGIKDGKPYRIDPHEIYETRFVGFDNIRRGTLWAAESNPPAYCRHLRRKLPWFDDFAVTAVMYPMLDKNPQFRQRYFLFQCSQFEGGR